MGQGQGQNVERKPRRTCVQTPRLIEGETEAQGLTADHSASGSEANARIPAETLSPAGC